MKKFIVGCLTMAMSVIVHAADTKAAKTGMPDPKMKEMMAKMEKYSKPTASHKVLADLAGEWNYTSRWWMTPDAQPQEDSGTSKMEMIMDGRWLRQEVSGSHMDRPFRGLALVGFDTVQNKYSTVWIDNMSTSMAKGTGTFDKKTRTLTDNGTFSCPLSEDKEQNYRSEWVLKDKNNMTFSMYGKGPTDGPEFKMMEMVYTRKTSNLGQK